MKNLLPNATDEVRRMMFKVSKFKSPIPIRWRFEEKCIRCLSHKPDHFGYPRFQRERKKDRIARFLLFRRYGHQPSSIVCRHTCDNKWCINPEHIIPGTTQDNIADSVSRGLIAIGSRNGQAKLTESLVVKIRLMADANIRQREIARCFGISKSTIHNVVKRKLWKHV